MQMKVQGYYLVECPKGMSGQWLGTRWTKDIDPETYRSLDKETESAEFQVVCDANAMRWIALWYDLPIAVADGLLEAIAILDRIESDVDRWIGFNAKMTAEAADMAEMDSDAPRNPIDC